MTMISVDGEAEVMVVNKARYPIFADVGRASGKVVLEPGVPTPVKWKEYIVIRSQAKRWRNNVVLDERISIVDGKPVINDTAGVGYISSSLMMDVFAYSDKLFRATLLEMKEEGNTEQIKLIYEEGKKRGEDAKVAICEKVLPAVKPKTEKKKAAKKKAAKKKAARKKRTTKATPK